MDLTNFILRIEKHKKTQFLELSLCLLLLLLLFKVFFSFNDAFWATNIN